ncbi:hypothetical protein HSX11_16080 [Oxalobacteraceae bacterium]|nr:hypothetical protein [Oxalobacteraceae bacterium]
MSIAQQLKAPMALLAALLLMPLACLAGSEQCGPMRMAYTSQAIPPYFMGSGARVASPPGASIEFFRDMAKANACEFTLERMPLARLRVSVDVGLIDASFLDQPSPKERNILRPLDSKGQLDYSRAVQVSVVVFVRAEDKAVAAQDPERFLATGVLGVTHGAAYATELRRRGYRVDDGANNFLLNLEKLRLHRIDGFAVGVHSEDDLDNMMRASHGARIERLDRPLMKTSFWLAVHRDYYNANRVQVERMWTWIGMHGHERMSDLVNKYKHQP